MDSIESHQADAMFNNSTSPAVKARLVSCKVKRSGAWLNVFPATPALTLINSHYALAFRLRLGLPPQDDLPLECKCGAILASDPDHFLSCKLLRRTIVTTRHDLIVRSLASFIRSAGGAVYVEPKFLGSLRPDAKVYFPSHSATVDVSITHPSCPSYALQGSKSPLAVAKLRESIKHNKYDAQALAEGTPFTPFVMETFGGLGKEAVGFIKKISYAYSELSPFPVRRGAFASLITRSLSILLQRGNALVQLAGCQVAREHAGHRLGYY
jgi:hypothetical protein